MLAVEVIVDVPINSDRDSIMAILKESDKEIESDTCVQKGSLMHFHARLGYDVLEKLVKDPKSGIMLTDMKRLNCSTCAQGKQTKNTRSKKDSGENAPADRIGGVICSDLKGQ